MTTPNLTRILPAVILTVLCLSPQTAAGQQPAEAEGYSKTTYIYKVVDGHEIRADVYRPVHDEGELWPGDVVVYRDDDNEIVHVGLISNIRTVLDRGTREIWVVSQWGADGEYLHRAEDVSMDLGKPTEYWTDRL